MMLTPFLDATAGWHVPGFIDLDAPTQTHFADRAREFGVRSVNGDWLKYQIEKAIAAGRDDLVERVFKICEVSALYRVLLPEGPFYPVVRYDTRNPADQLVIVTLYDTERMRATRAARGSRKRRKGTRLRATVRR